MRAFGDMGWKLYSAFLAFETHSFLAFSHRYNFVLISFRYVFDRGFYNDTDLPQSIKVPDYFSIKV